MDIQFLAGFDHAAACFYSLLMALDAGKALKGKLYPEDIGWEDIEQNLYTDGLPDPDLIVRTSGENRLSNFLLMQSAYAEFYFTPTCWPDFTKAHLQEAIDSYHSRERRFGRTGEQLDRETTLSH